MGMSQGAFVCRSASIVRRAFDVIQVNSPVVPLLFRQLTTHSPQLNNRLGYPAREYRRKTIVSGKTPSGGCTRVAYPASESVALRAGVRRRDGKSHGDQYGRQFEIDIRSRAHYRHDLVRVRTCSSMASRSAARGARRRRLASAGQRPDRRSGARMKYRVVVERVPKSAEGDRCLAFRWETKAEARTAECARRRKACTTSASVICGSMAAVSRHFHEIVLARLLDATQAGCCSFLSTLFGNRWSVV